MKKRFIAYILILLCLLSFVACNTSKDINYAAGKGRYTEEETFPAQTEKVTEKKETEPQRETENDITETEAETEPEVIEDIRLSFLCCGDNIGHESVYNDAQRRATEDSYEYNFLPMYDGVRSLFASADIKFINQETVTADASFGYHGYPNFNTPQDMGRTIVDLGFDIVNIATNHMLDMRAAGYQSELDFWKTQDILMIGGYENEEDYNTIRYFETNGIKIALLSYTYGTNGIILDYGSSLVVPYIDSDTITRQVTAAKESADLVFVSMHWGTDSSLEITSEQKQYAQLLTNLGVDVVIGHHSHTLQDMEWKENSEGHKTLIIYSLGNLLHSMYYDASETRNYCFLVGGVATFDIVISQTDGIYIDNPLYHPTVCHYTKDPTGQLHAGNFCVYELKDYTEELCSEHSSQREHRFTLANLYDYVKAQVSPEFLTEDYK